LTVRGKILRGYVGDDPVARDYRDYHGWEALLLERVALKASLIGTNSIERIVR
jgi:hypothetical protein